MYQQFKRHIQHVHGIHITPFDEQGNVDWGSLGQNIDFLLDSGLRVIVTGGNTGEFYSLRIEEAQAVTRFVVNRVAKRALVIVGIGYDSRTAGEMARNAERCGADGLMLHQPVHPFVLEEGLIRYYMEVAEASKLPLLLYVRGQQISINLLQSVGRHPRIAGIKFAVNDVLLFTKCVREVNADYVWICGGAERWAPFFAMAGAVGFTSGLVNIVPEKSLAMFECLRGANYARALDIWREIEPFERLRADHGDGNNVSAVKEAMAQLGLCSRSVRAPIAELSEGERVEVTRILQSWNKQ